MCRFLLWTSPCSVSFKGWGLIQYDLILLVQDADYGTLCKCKIMTEYAFNHVVLRCPRILFVSQKPQICSAWNMGACAVPHANLLLKRQEEELSTSRTCLFRIRLQSAHIWASLGPPHPSLPLSVRVLPRKQGSPTLLLIKG